MIKKIVEELIDKKNSLINPLLKAKVLASRIKNKSLADWVEKEINGYKNESIPDYRIVNANAICDIYINGSPYKVSTPFPISFLKDKKIREIFTTIELRDGVESMENYFLDGNDSITRPLGVDFENAITLAIKENGFVGRIHNLSISTYKTEVIQTISVIRNKFLNLMLEIEADFPDVEDITSEPENIKQEISNTITIIMAKNNYITGDGSNVVSGDNNQTNFSSGDNNTQTNTLDNKEKERVEMVIEEIKNFIKSNEFEDKEEAFLEVQRIENQLSKDQPKKSVIQQSLNALKDIFTGVTANILSGPVMESITKTLQIIG